MDGIKKINKSEVLPIIFNSTSEQFRNDYQSDEVDFHGI